MSELKKTTNEQERERYRQLIAQREIEMDEINAGKQKIEQAITELESDLQRGFQQLVELNNEEARHGNSENLRLLQNNEKQAHFFQQKLQESQDQINSAYNTEAKKLDDERESLYKKRGEIPWD